MTSFIKNDEFVTTITEQSESALCSIAIQFDCKPVVHIMETIHGHIAILEKDTVVPKGSADMACSLDMEQMRYFTEGFEGVRYVSTSRGALTVAFDNRKFETVFSLEAADKRAAALEAELREAVES